MILCFAYKGELTYIAIRLDTDRLVNDLLRATTVRAKVTDRYSFYRQTPMYP